MMDPALQQAKEGDLVQLVGPRDKMFFLHLAPGEKMHTNYGYINHDDMIQAPWGSVVFSHAGQRFMLLRPRIGDFLLKIRRNTQILYPKDIGFLLLNLGIGPGDIIIEAGTGSGALTTALAHAVGPTGHIFSYEIRPELQGLARKNLALLDLTDRVTFRSQDLAEGIDDQVADVMVLDLPRPEAYLPQVRRALKNGGSLGSILPTMNQVSTYIKALEQLDFDCIEVCEILIRYYKPVAARLRPKDRMVGHTGYLIFARKILPLRPD
jgi:tRNA (adenine57-N1/adenine58-N1)-methyltransferase